MKPKKIPYFIAYVFFFVFLYPSTWYQPCGHLELPVFLHLASWKKIFTHGWGLLLVGSITRGTETWNLTWPNGLDFPYTNWDHSQLKIWGFWGEKQTRVELNLPERKTGRQPEKNIIHPKSFEHFELIPSSGSNCQKQGRVISSDYLYSCLAA